MAHAGPLGLRLFLEGVEVPVISSLVVSAPSAPSSAAIQIVPTEAALNLLPRTLVHLFYLDELSKVDSEIAADTAVSEVSERELRSRFLVDDARYRLLFSGEYVGCQYVKSEGRRCFVLQCLDLSIFWDVCYQWFADYSGTGVTDTYHLFAGAGVGNFDNVAQGAHETIARALQRTPVNPAYKDAQGLLGGIIHLLELIGGVSPSPDGSFEGYKGVNDYFTVAELRYNLSGMIGAAVSDSTSKKLYANEAFQKWIVEGMGSLGYLVNFRTVLRAVCERIFHDVYPNPVAHYVAASTGPAETVVSEGGFLDSPSGKPAKDKLIEARSLLVTAQNAFGEAGASTVATTVVAFSASVAPFRDARRALDAALLHVQQRNPAGFHAVIVTKIRLALAELGEPERIINRVALSGTSAAAAALDQVTLTPSLALRIATLIDRAIKIVGELLGRKGASAETPAKRQVQLGSHLFNQLILPETFFVAPPRCNVIFPDQYHSFTYERNFMREYTRFLLDGGIGLGETSERDAAMFQNYFLAPDTFDVRGKLLHTALEQESRTLLPHEVHSGIIPKFEWVSEGLKWGVNAAAGEDTKLYRAYMQRLANFQFMMARWKPRTMKVDGMFLPNLVLGLPAVVIDQVTQSPEILKRMRLRLSNAESVIPSAFLGKIVNLSHSVDQTGGSTSVALSYVRTHRGVDDEFLGLLSREKTESIEKSHVVKPRDLLKSGKLSDLDKALLTGVLTNSVQKGSRVKEYKVVKVEKKGEVSLTQAEAQSLTIDSRLLKADASGALVLLLPEVMTFELSYEKGTGQIFQDKTPVEQLLMPFWFDKNTWESDKITGAVYNPLLGTSAITDDLEVATDTTLDELVSSAFDGLKVERSTELARGGVSLQDNLGETVLKFSPPTGKIERAVDSVILLYSAMRSRGMQMHEFVREFTRRPVARLTEVLGSPDFHMDERGNVLAGSPGFHSRAFGDYNADVRYVSTGGGGHKPVAGKNALGGLFPPGVAAPTRQIISRKSAPAESIPPHVDPRGRARARVKAYVDELNVSRGLIG